jgi:hypothetical protein
VHKLCERAYAAEQGKCMYHTYIDMANSGKPVIPLNANGACVCGPMHHHTGWQQMLT